jgi:K+ transporter
MVLWFCSLSVFGIVSLLEATQVLKALKVEM